MLELSRDNISELSHTQAGTFGSYYCLQEFIRFFWSTPKDDINTILNLIGSQAHYM